MRNSKLTEHEFKKGKFITPFNKVLSSLLKEESWFYGRLPEYLWLGLIIDGGERTEQLGKCMDLLRRLKELDEDKLILSPKISSILKLSEQKQVSFFRICRNLN